MDNWVEIVVAIYLLGMILYGHYKGFIRLAVSMAALIVTLVIEIGRASCRERV